MTFEEIKKEFTDNGFRIDGDSFVYESVEYSTINFNGQIHKQPHKIVFEMKYIGEGSISDVSDSDSDVDETPLYSFDILNDGESAYTICIENFNDFKSLTGQ